MSSYHVFFVGMSRQYAILDENLSLYKYFHQFIFFLNLHSYMLHYFKNKENKEAQKYVKTKIKQE